MGSKTLGRLKCFGECTAKPRREGEHLVADMRPVTATAERAARPVPRDIYKIGTGSHY